MADGGAPKRTYRDRFVCCLCEVDIIRMNVHLIKQHCLSRKDSVFNPKLGECTEIVLQDKGATHLLRALNGYGNSMKDRERILCQGNTVQSHSTAVCFFMVNLKRNGDGDGFIDTQLKEKRVQPETLKTYFHSLANFLLFLSGSQKWLRHLLMNINEMKVTEQKMRQIAKSLKADILKNAMERQANEQNDLMLEPWMVGWYLDGNRAGEVRDLLDESRHRDLSRAETLEVRDGLCTQILLTNAKRAVDVAHIERRALEKVVSQNGADVEIFVEEHKEAKSGENAR